MGKKTKVGKQRRDKFYQLAKESGYRSRASFKLIQLNRKYDFLSSARIVVDLCAAPGVDLVPIRPIANTIALQGDITQDITRVAIMKELKTNLADVVLHDGAPNVGQNWIHDAFMQAQLTLSALRLATQILRRGGTFVTKIFRSKDYMPLLSVFERLFSSVAATKPQASRNESAEIFVVCRGFTRPDKIDRQLLDSRSVFKELQLEPDKPTLSTLISEKRRKPKADGYADGRMLMFTRLPASEFVRSDEYVALLSEASQVCGKYDQHALNEFNMQIVLDDERFDKHALTTDEIRACFKDVKVLGRRSLRDVLAWRKAMRALIAETTVGDDEPLPVAPNEDELEDEQMKQIDEQILNAKADEKSALKRRKRKMQKERAKRKQAYDLQMKIHGDIADIPDEVELFSLKRMKSGEHVAAFEARPMHGDGTMLAGDDESDDRLSEQDDGVDSANPLLVDGDGTAEADVDTDERARRRANLWFSREIFVDADSDDDERVLDEIVAAQKRRSNKRGSDQRPLDDAERMDEGTFVDDDVDPESSDEIKIGESEAVAETSSASSDSEDDNNEDGGGLWKPLPAESAFAAADTRSTIDFTNNERGDDARKNGDKPRKSQLTPLDAHGLALAEQLVHSSKTRRDVIDRAWNRYTNNDTDVPSWFADDERRHWRAHVPVSAEALTEYRDRQRAIDARPIKKVAEAKARKKKRAERRMARAQKQSETITDNPDLSAAEKQRQLVKMHKQAAGKRKPIKYIKMTKSKRGSTARPRGPYKVVDNRLKKDLRAKTAKDKRQGKKKPASGGGKRRPMKKR